MSWQVNVLVGKCLRQANVLLGKCKGREMSQQESVLVGNCQKQVKVWVGRSPGGKCLVGKCLVRKCPGTVMAILSSMVICLAFVSCSISRDFPLLVHSPQSRVGGMLQGKWYIIRGHSWCCKNRPGQGYFCPTPEAHAQNHKS